MISLSLDDVVLDLLPLHGGGVARFAVAGIDIFRPFAGEFDRPTSLASFPLLPFSGRIDRGCFEAHGQKICLPPNFDDEPLHALHGHGWQAPWSVITQTENILDLRYHHSAGDWPWCYLAGQSFRLGEAGYRHHLSIQNLGETAMPTGLGLHPYFPRRAASIETRFAARWLLDPDHLPTERLKLRENVNWWAGPVIDTGFDGFDGKIVLSWPTHRLTMDLDAALNHVVIYVPNDPSYFCVEPVSHVANAINHDGMRWLEPGEAWSVAVDFSVALTG